MYLSKVELRWSLSRHLYMNEIPCIVALFDHRGDDLLIGTDQADPWCWHLILHYVVQLSQIVAGHQRKDVMFNVLTYLCYPLNYS